VLPPSSGRWVLLMITHRPDDGGSTDLWNVGKLLPDYTALQPRRQPSSYSPSWEPQILLNIVRAHYQTSMSNHASSRAIWKETPVVMPTNNIHLAQWHSLINIYVSYTNAVSKTAFRRHWISVPYCLVCSVVMTDKSIVFHSLLRTWVNKTHVVNEGHILRNHVYTV
jgi:hypothetical protein